MEENIPQNVSLPPSSSVSKLMFEDAPPVELKQDCFVVEIDEEEVGSDELKLEIAKLKETVKKQEEAIKEQKEIIDRKNAEIVQIKNAHENEKSQIIAENIELKTVFDEQQETINQLTQKIQRLETSARQRYYQMNDLTEKLGYLIKPKQICTLSDVVVNGKIDYERLNGRILVINNLEYNGTTWLTDNTKIIFTDTSFEICIANNFFAIRVNLSPVINRIFYSTLKELYLKDSSMTYFEYKKIAHSLRQIQLFHVTVKDKYGNDIRVTDLIKEVTATVEVFKYVFKHGELITGIAQQFSALPAFPRLKKLFLWDIQEGFDLLTFAKFVKKNPTVFYWLDFKCSSKFFDGIRETAAEVIPKLPPACHVKISKYS